MVPYTPLAPDPVSVTMPFRMFAGQFALTIAALFTEAAIYITSPSILGERLPGALQSDADQPG